MSGSVRHVRARTQDWPCSAHTLGCSGTAHERLARKAGVAEAALPLIREGAPADRLVSILQPDELAVYTLAQELMATKRVSAATYHATREALGGDGDRKMADLCMTMGCYSAVSKLLNMFEVALPPGEPLPFPDAG